MKMLTVGKQIKVKAIDLDFKGQGVSKVDNYVIFTPGILAGEVALVEISQIKDRFAQANLIEVISISKDRVKDTSMLGSIDLYHLSIDKQIQWQERITKETFSKIANQDIVLNETITDERYVYYRNKSVFHVLEEETIKCGMYLKNYLLTETHQFILADKLTNKFLNIINRSMIPIERNVIKHVAFRTNEQNQILITFIATKEKVKYLDLLVKRLSEHEEVVGITLNIKDHPKRIFGKKSITLYKENKIIQKLNQYDLPINDRSFFQINYPVMKKVFEVINKHIEQNKVIVEAYSGIGVIGLSLIDKMKRMVMIESQHENVMMAKSILKTYMIKKIKVVEAKAEEVIDKYQGDILIVDPPRAGLMKKFIYKIKEMNFNEMIYLSCDVKTLARDYKLLSDMYEITHIYPIRMFHHTISIETLVILKKKQS